MKYFRGSVVRSCMLLVMLSLMCSGASAVDKLSVTSDDIALWHSMHPASISNDGVWVRYNIVNDNSEADTVSYLVNRSNASTHRLAPGSGAFSDDSRWHANGSAAGVELVNLRDGTKRKFKGASSFQFSGDGRRLLIHGQDRVEGSVGSSLVILDLAGGNQKVIPNVKEYKLDNTATLLAYVVVYDDMEAIELIDLTKAYDASTLVRKNGVFSSIVWGNGVDFLVLLRQLPASEGEGELNSIYFWSKVNSRDRRLHILEGNDYENLPKGMVVSSRGLHVSEDGSTVLFDLLTASSPGEEAPGSTVKGEAANVQIWHYRDDFIHTDTDQHRAPTRRAAWVPAADIFTLIESGRQEFAVYLESEKYALTYDEGPYLPSFNRFTDYADIYLVDVMSGERRKLIDKQRVHPQFVVVSPSGRYISYFSNDGWWMYDVKLNRHVEVSAALPYPLVEPRGRAPAGNLRPYGMPGWTAGEEKIVIYDQYDIWLVSPDGTSLERLTNGRDDHIVYRLYELSHDRNPNLAVQGHVVDIAMDLTLTAFGERTKRSGYFLRHPDGMMSSLVFEDAKVDFLMKSRDVDVYTYRRQRFDVPPELIAVDRSMNKPKVIAHSNPHHHRFNWGKSEVVEYRDSTGELLQGALFYPANYSAGSTYPMIVSIYERMSHRVHEFVPPVDGTAATFPVSNFTNNGYFVLLPDIFYRDNDTGMSAVDSVSSAVKSVLGTGMVDAGAVGLHGHSFGGYEATFIITQTDLFAAAIVGAGPTDSVSYYLGISYFGEPEVHRFESGQWRMTGPLHERYDDYIRNSPTHHASTISTPLLTFHGGKDTMVKPIQSIMMHNFLRRMGKEHVLLVYPDGDHILTNDDDAADLLGRFTDWFDYHLKGKEPPAWIIEGDRAH